MAGPACTAGADAARPFDAHQFGPAAPLNDDGLAVFEKNTPPTLDTTSRKPYFVDGNGQCRPGCRSGRRAPGGGGRRATAIIQPLGPRHDARALADPGAGTAQCP